MRFRLRVEQLLDSLFRVLSFQRPRIGGHWVWRREITALMAFGGSSVMVESWDWMTR